MQEDKRLRALHGHVRTADAFADWLRDHADDLLDAVAVLGGGRWIVRARDTIQAIRNGASPQARLADLKAIRRLLHLEHADRPGSDEAARFAAVHPDDPRADNARRCAEALDRGISAIAALVVAPVAGVREVA